MVLNTFQTEKAVSHLFVKGLYVFRVDQVGALELENMDEKMYIFYENKIKAALRPMVHVIKSMLRNLKEKNQRLA